MFFQNSELLFEVYNGSKHRFALVKEFQFSSQMHFQENPKGRSFTFVRKPFEQVKLQGDTRDS